MFVPRGAVLLKNTKLYAFIGILYILPFSNYQFTFTPEFLANTFVKYRLHV
jgi:hypothetical protein